MKIRTITIIGNLLLVVCAFHIGMYIALIANSVQAGEPVESTARGILGVWITWCTLDLARSMGRVARLRRLRRELGLGDEE